MTFGIFPRNGSSLGSTTSHCFSCCPFYHNLKQKNRRKSVFFTCLYSDFWAETDLLSCPHLSHFLTFCLPSDVNPSKAIARPDLYFLTCDVSNFFDFWGPVVHYRFGRQNSGFLLPSRARDRSSSLGGGIPRCCFLLRS